MVSHTGEAKSPEGAQSMRLGVSAVPTDTRNLEDSWRLLVFSLCWKYKERSHLQYQQGLQQEV